MAVTSIQRKADELDLDMFRVVGRMLAFAETLPRREQAPIRAAAVEFASKRNLVRAFMAPARREETTP